MIDKKILIILLNNYSEYKWYKTVVKKTMDKYIKLEKALELMRKNEDMGELYYQIIGSRYIFDYLDNNEIMEKLNLTGRTFYRHLNQALKCLMKYY